MALSLYLGLPPFTLNYDVLHSSWQNKNGHSWGEEDSRAGRNNHAYHHTLHDKNFGIFNIVLDMYMGTAANKPRTNEYGEWVVTKEHDEKEGLATFKFEIHGEPVYRYDSK